MEFQELFDLPPVFQPLSWKAAEDAGIRVQVLREDLRHPVLGGNKLWKLKYNLEDYRNSGSSCIVSFGGAYSNHLLAISEACHQLAIPLHAFIRGEEEPLNERIERMISVGTIVHYLSRSEYRKKEDTIFLQHLLNKFQLPHNSFIIPEGANNASGRRGCSELGKLIPITTHKVLVAVGTGGTMKGLLEGISESTLVTGILTGHFKDVSIQSSRAHLLTNYAWKGYGKWEDGLMSFMKQFSLVTAIPLEPVYTGKLFYALNDLVEKGYFQRGSEITVLHSGGLG